MDKGIIHRRELLNCQPFLIGLVQAGCPIVPLVITNRKTKLEARRKFRELNNILKMSTYCYILILKRTSETMSEPLSIEVGMTGLNPHLLNLVYPLALGTLNKNMGLIISFQIFVIITELPTQKQISAESLGYIVSQCFSC